MGPRAGLDNVEEEEFLASVCNRTECAIIALLCRFAVVINTGRKWQWRACLGCRYGIVFCSTF